MRYEWDEEKNRRNQRKHGGISFELAVLVFEDECCLVLPWWYRRADRRAAVDRARDAAVLLVVAHVYLEDEHGEEIIRIISARKAEKRGVGRYQAQALDED